MSKPSSISIPPDIYNPTSPRFSLPSQPLVPVNSFGLPDLEYLSDDNIGTVIDTLKATFCGPEVWMTVAAHYRRKQLHKCALAVVDSMLEGNYPIYYLSSEETT